MTFAEGEKQTGDINISIWVRILKYPFTLSLSTRTIYIHKNKFIFQIKYSDELELFETFDLLHKKFY